MQTIEAKITNDSAVSKLPSDRHRNTKGQLRTCAMKHGILPRLAVLAHALHT